MLSIDSRFEALLWGPVALCKAVKLHAVSSPKDDPRGPTSEGLA